MMNLKKLSIYLILIAFTMLMQSCPDCTTPVPSSQTDSDIIFTGKALNSFKPGIYLIREDGWNLQELLSDAEIFSGISNDGKFVFLRTTPDGKNKLIKYDFNQNNIEYPIDDTTYPVKNYPVRSKDGKYIAFFTGNDEIVSGENGVWFSAVFNICPKTLPVFSPDSRYIAFYEGDSLGAPLRINVVQADNPGILVAFKELSFGIQGLKGLAKLDWSQQDLIVYSYTRNSSLDIIGIWNVTNPSNSYELQLKENLGAFNPTISPDKTRIMFTARDGNLWFRNFTEDTLSPAYWVDIGQINDNEYIAYPSWSYDGTKILYTRFFKNMPEDSYSGKLEIIENVGTDSSKTRLICDNINRAFWRNK